MFNLLSIASLTLREASRRRLVVTAAIATLVLVALTGFGFHALAAMHGRDGRPVDHHVVLTAASGLETAMAFMFSFILALGAAFLGALSLGSEIENGTLLAMLPRPIRRIEVLLGKWLGNAILIACYAAGTALLEFAVVRAITGYLPPHIVAAIALLVAQALVMLTVTLAVSVRLPAIASGFVTLVLFGIAWMAGIVGSIATAMHNDALRQATTAVSLVIPSDGLWRAAAFMMQPAVLRAAAPANSVDPLVPSTAPPLAYFIWCALWLAVVLASGVRSFQRRDL